MPGTHKLEIKYIGSKCILTTMENVKRIIYESFHLKKGKSFSQEGCIASIISNLIVSTTCSEASLATVPDYSSGCYYNLMITK